jgi:O-antigen/teichoic acid export membrane protein
MLRAAISFVTGILIARAFSPSGYGDLMFLIGSFSAIRILLDMGSSSAFFTFLSQRARGMRFYVSYTVWMAVQFILSVATIWFFLPNEWLDAIWLGHDRNVVVLAFVAVFMQQQLWQAIVQIGESMRKTVLIQLLNLSVALVYLVVIMVLLIFNRLSIEMVLTVLIVEYIAAILVAAKLLQWNRIEAEGLEESLGEIVRNYWTYCRPMLMLAIVGFAYEFANKWILQKYGGAAQQGYFQIANQFAAVSLLATSSILNVFWKEIAHAWELGDRARVERLYRKVSRGLVMLGAGISGMLVPWSEQIVGVILGSAYSDAWPVLALMLMYPIHQSMGQIGGAMLLASGQTGRYMYVSVAVMMVSIPLTFLVLAPADGMPLSGLGAGAVGMACLMVTVGIVSVNIQAWVIARSGGWEFDWTFQLVGIGMMVGLGYLVKTVVSQVWDLNAGTWESLLMPVIAATLGYLLLWGACVWRCPTLFGTNHVELRKLLNRG